MGEEIKVGDKVVAKISTGTILSGVVEYIGSKRGVEPITQRGGDNSIWATDWVVMNGSLSGTLFAGGGTYYVDKNQVLTKRKGRWLRFEKLES